MHGSEGRFDAHRLQASSLGDNTRGPALPVQGKAKSVVRAASRTGTAYTPEQLAAAAAAVDNSQDDLRRERLAQAAAQAAAPQPKERKASSKPFSQIGALVSTQDSVGFELSLDQIACSLAPRRSWLDRLPVLFDWKAKRLKRTAPKPLEPVIHSLSAVFRAGSLVAIMGPSGCGKTTLLSIISGRSSMAYSGQVLLNGHPLEKDFDSLSSYIPQGDCFEGNETVEECLRFSYRLRKAVPREWKAEELRVQEQEAIDRALKLLGLETLQHSRVGSGLRRGLSGGQKRRLTIGIGLMSDAKILLCDEPTTGLSAADAQLVVGALRRLSAECGMAVVAVIHQPSHAILRSFDHLLLMSYEGRCVYNSRVDAALQYFSALGFPCPVHQNPADFFLDLVSQSGEHAQELADMYDVLMRPLVGAQVRQARECPPAEPENLAEAMRVAGPFTQTKEVASRSFRLWLRDQETLFAILIDSVVQGVVIGGVLFNARHRASVYYQLSALFLLVVSHLAASLWTVPLYVQQKAQFAIEVADGFYSPVPFIFATCLVANFFVLFGNFLLVTIMWVLFGFAFVPLLVCWVVSAMGFVVCDSVAVICSLASATFAEANASATLLFFLIMFVNGFTTNPALLGRGLGWISYFSPFFLVFEALVICILEPYDFSTAPSATSGNLALRTKEEVYETFGLAGRAYGYTGSAFFWMWSVDVLLLFGLMLFSKCLTFALQATVFMPKRYKGKAMNSRRPRCFSLGRWIFRRWLA